jgi:hypothetical protein
VEIWLGVKPTSLIVLGVNPDPGSTQVGTVSGFRVQGSGFNVLTTGLRVEGSRLRVEG